MISAPKLLKRWSGRRDSNPRRPAWEIDRKLTIQTLASTESMEGDRISLSFSDLLLSFSYRSKSGAKELWAKTKWTTH